LGDDLSASIPRSEQLSSGLPLYGVALILMLAMPAGTFVYVVARIER
jgi:hypothetical protein